MKKRGGGLRQALEQLKKDERVDSVCLAGSTNLSGTKPDSDIDLLIILKKSTPIRFGYLWINNIFADILFFETREIKKIIKQDVLDGDSIEGVMLDWLKGGNIYFDRTNQLTSLKATIRKKKLLGASKKGLMDLWWKINYDFVVNKRYFDSGKKVYHNALEIRLLYSVRKLLSGYSAFHNRPWRGERGFLKFLAEKDKKFLQLFKQYTRAEELPERFAIYTKMVHSTLKKDSLWTKKTIVSVGKDYAVFPQKSLEAFFVESLFKSG